MSIDDTIIIAEFPDGFRVEHVQAADNLTYFKKGSKDWHETLDEFFGESEVLTKEDAEKKANILEKKALKDYGFTEYGVCDFGFFDHKFK